MLILRCFNIRLIIICWVMNFLYFIVILLDPLGTSDEYSPSLSSKSLDEQSSWPNRQSRPAHSRLFKKAHWLNSSSLAGKTSWSDWVELNYLRLIIRKHAVAFTFYCIPSWGLDRFISFWTNAVSVSQSFLCSIFVLLVCFFSPPIWFELV